MDLPSLSHNSFLFVNCQRGGDVPGVGGGEWGRAAGAVTLLPRKPVPMPALSRAMPLPARSLASWALGSLVLEGKGSGSISPGPKGCRGVVKQGANGAGGRNHSHARTEWCPQAEHKWPMAEGNVWTQ